MARQIVFNAITGLFDLIDVSSVDADAIEAFSYFMGG